MISIRPSLSSNADTGREAKVTELNGKLYTVAKAQFDKKCARRWRTGNPANVSGGEKTQTAGKARSKIVIACITVVRRANLGCNLELLSRALGSGIARITPEHVPLRVRFTPLSGRMLRRVLTSALGQEQTWPHITEVTINDGARPA